MECNRDEAVRAKSIAESKLEQKDYTSAQKFALKAQSIFPGLVGISQLLTMLQVYVSAEPRHNGEVNWYDVLGVDPYADDLTIKKHYRKLALMVHPDKNSCIGADDAFKLISEAWSVLSDKAEKLEYDYRLGYKVRPNRPVIPHWMLNTQNVPTRPTGPSAQPPAPSTAGPSAPPPAPSSAGTSAPTPPAPSTAGPSAPPPPAPSTAGPSGPPPPANPSTAGPSKCARRDKSAAPVPRKGSAKVSRKRARGPILPTSDTFWTACYHCDRKFEHSVIFYNITIYCNVCQKPFLASETVPPFEFKRTQDLFQRRKGSVKTC